MYWNRFILGHRWRISHCPALCISKLKWVKLYLAWNFFFFLPKSGLDQKSEAIFLISDLKCSCFDILFDILPLEIAKSGFRWALLKRRKCTLKWTKPSYFKIFIFPYQSDFVEKKRRKGRTLWRILYTWPNLLLFKIVTFPSFSTQSYAKKLLISDYICILPIT